MIKRVARFVLDRIATRWGEDIDYVNYCSCVDTPDELPHPFVVFLCLTIWHLATWAWGDGRLLDIKIDN